MPSQKHSQPTVCSHQHKLVPCGSNRAQYRSTTTRSHLPYWQPPAACQATRGRLPHMCRWLQQKRDTAVTVTQSQSQATFSPFAQGQPPTQAALARLGLPGQGIKRSEDIRRRLLVTLLVVGFYYYPSLVIDALSFFACYTVDQTGSDVMYPDTLRVCTTL